jgi:ornithine cyclodeaminase
LTLFLTADQIKNSIDSMLAQEYVLNSLMQSQKQAFIDEVCGLYESITSVSVNIRPNDCHVKGGRQLQQDLTVIKVATGAYNNYAAGLPPGDGVFIVLSAKTGLLQAILHDRGCLTTLRTGLAVCNAISITPWQPVNIGIVGTGQVAKQCIELLKALKTNCLIHIWGRNGYQVQVLVDKYQLMPCETVSSLSEICDVIITATASSQPLIDKFYKNQHIISLGADEPYKQELSLNLFEEADFILIDSLEQASKCGNVVSALIHKSIEVDNLKKIGFYFNCPDKLIGFNRIITNLTGVGIQDVAIANLFCNHVSLSS